jgi:hypothetical protein
MIRGAEVLLTAAEIGIGLAGFSGVVAAFTRLRTEDRVRFLMLVGGSFFVVVLAFVPFLLDLAGLTERGVWRWSSAIWAILFAGCIPLLRAGRRVIVAHGTPAPGWSIVLIVGVVAAVSLVQLGNVAGWPYAPGPVPFILALMSGLVASGAIFVYIVLIRPEESLRPLGEGQTG